MAACKLQSTPLKISFLRPVFFWRYPVALTRQAEGYSSSKGTTPKGEQTAESFPAQRFSIQKQRRVAPLHDVSFCKRAPAAFRDPAASSCMTQKGGIKNYKAILVDGPKTAILLSGAGCGAPWSPASFGYHGPALLSPSALPRKESKG